MSDLGGRLFGSAEGSTVTLPVLEVQELEVRFPGRTRWLRERRMDIRPVAGVSLELAPGETVGLVGESGCGKSTLARAIVGLVPVSAGVVRVGGVDLTTLRGGDLQCARRSVQLIFQDPYGSLNPRLRVGTTIWEALNLRKTNSLPNREKIAALLFEVGLDPEVRYCFPHQLSGGQRQRVAIARALAVDPLVLVADEPTSALDVPVQTRILNLLREVQMRHDMAMLLITHDLHLVRKVCHKVAVMYLGHLVELMPVTEQVQPLHPYSRALAAAAPSLLSHGRGETSELPLGEVPSFLKLPPGCPFAPRCKLRKPICDKALPLLAEAGEDHLVRCPVTLQVHN